MRELLWQIEELNRKQDTWEVLGYVDPFPQSEAVRVGGKEYPYLGTDETLLAGREEADVVISAGSPSLRRKIAGVLGKNPQLHFPNLILTDTNICSDIRMGKGNIISMDCRISTNVTIGDFVFLNMGAVVCHDGILEDYVTLSPDARLAGNVSVGTGSELGIGTRVMQGIRIGAGTVIGGGSMVIRDIPDACTAVGVPARVIKQGPGEDVYEYQDNCGSRSES